MNLKKLTTRELEQLINSTADLKLLEQAEEEYIIRATSRDLEDPEDCDYSDVASLVMRQCKGE